MSAFILLVRIAMHAARAQWPGVAALAAGAALTAAALAAIPAFDGVLRDLALREALDGAPAADLRVRVTSEDVALDRTAYSETQAAIDGAMGAALAGAAAAPARMGTTEVFDLRTLAARDGVNVSELAGTAALRFRSGIADRVALLDGAFPEAQPRALGDPVEALISADTAGALGASAGTLLTLWPTGAVGGPPTLVRVAGVARPLDADDPYWADEPALLDLAGGTAFALIVPEATFFGAAAELLGSALGTFEASYAVSPSRVRASDAAALVERIDALAGDAGALPGARVESGLPRAMASARGGSALDRPALAILFGQIAAVAGAFVAVTSARLARARRGRVEALVLRGATPAQRAAVEALTVLPAALAALALGPPLAAGGVAALGRLDAFRALAGGGWLRFELTTETALYGAIGALAAFALALVPAALAARRTPGEGRAPDARPGLAAGGTALLLVAAGAGFAALTRGDRLFAPDGREAAIDHALLFAPAAVLLPAAVGGWWALPHLARPLAWLAAMGRGVVALEALRTASRRPAGAAFALVVVAAGGAVLLATLPGALDRSPAERAAHAAGADVRASGLGALDGAGERAFRAAIASVPADAASAAARAPATLRAAGGVGPPVAIEVLGVEPSTFGRVAEVRGDFAPQPLDAMLGALATNATTLGGVPAPAGTRQLGAWVRLHDVAGEVRIALLITDAAGRSVELLLARVDSSELIHWGFLATDLATPLGLDGAPIGGPPLETPLTIRAYYADLGADAAADAGGVSFGPLVSTLDAPAEPLDAVERLVPRATEFARRVILHDPAADAGLEPIAGLALGGAPQTVRVEASNLPGASGAVRIDWPRAAPGEPPPTVRGLRQETDGAPVLLYASRRTLDDLGAAVGDALRLEVAGRVVEAQAAGALDHFPTLGAGGEGFAVASLDRLLAAVNASPGATLRADEAWFAASAPDAAARALAAPEIAAAAIVTREGELASLDAARTLARGWRGVLTLGFAALLALAVLAAASDALAAPREAEEEAALAEALGGDGGAVMAAAALAVIGRTAAAGALGIAAGILLAGWLVGILGADPAGAVIVPPPRAEVAAGPLLAVGGALAASCAAGLAVGALRWRRRARRDAWMPREWATGDAR